MLALIRMLIVLEVEVLVPVLALGSGEARRGYRVPILHVMLERSEQRIFGMCIREFLQ
jgi:hypothetical protein